MSDELPQNPPDDALIDLLVKHVTEGLSPAEQRELDVLDGPATSAYLRDFERAGNVACDRRVDSDAPAAVFPCGNFRRGGRFRTILVGSIKEQVNSVLFVRHSRESWKTSLGASYPDYTSSARHCFRCRSTQPRLFLVL